jgi:hypothetical protein
MSMSGEIWRDVPSLPEVLVSSEGRVMYRPYRKAMPNGGVRTYGGVPHWGSWSKRDARWVVVVGGKTYKVARLVAEAFRGPPPFEGAVAMHLNENAANNRASNIKWGTQKDNLNAPGFLEYCRNRIGENSPTVKAKRKREAEWLRKLRQCDMFDSSMENAE